MADLAHVDFDPIKRSSLLLSNWCGDNYLLKTHLSPWKLIYVYGSAGSPGERLSERPSATFES